MCGLRSEIRNSKCQLLLREYGVGMDVLTGPGTWNDGKETCVPVLLATIPYPGNLLLPEFHSHLGL